MAEYALMAAAVLAAAFHSGSETGLYCVNQLRARLRAEQGSAPARSLQHLLSRPRLAISTMLVGTNIGLYVATVVCTHQLRDTALAARADLYSSLIMPPVLLIFAEIIPKSLFQHHAEKLMYRVARPLRVSEALFYPLSALLRAVSGLPYLLLGRRAPDRRPLVTDESFRFYLGRGAADGVLSSYQRRMAENILRLKSMRLGAALSPLEEVVMVAEGAPPGELHRLMREHRYSRIPVYRKERDDITGVVNVIDVASAPESAGPAELAREVMSLPLETSVADALSRFRDAKEQFAVVTDEEGRAVGVVTVKDLVEEIVGELEAW